MDPKRFSTLIPTALAYTLSNYLRGGSAGWRPKNAQKHPFSHFWDSICIACFAKIDQKLSVFAKKNVFSCFFRVFCSYFARKHSFHCFDKKRVTLDYGRFGKFFHDKTRFFFHCEDAEIASGTLFVIFDNVLPDADARRNCHWVVVKFSVYSTMLLCCSAKWWSNDQKAEFTPHKPHSTLHLFFVDINSGLLSAYLISIETAT